MKLLLCGDKRCHTQYAVNLLPPSKQIGVESDQMDSFPSKRPEDAITNCGGWTISPEFSRVSSCEMQLNKKKSLNSSGRLYCIFPRIPDVINLRMICNSTVLLFVWHEPKIPL